MQISIRGAFGTQLFEYISGNTQAKKNNEIVDRVLINAGSTIWDANKVDWLSQIIQVPQPVDIVTGMLKQGVWKNPNLLKDICDNKLFVSTLKLTRPIQKNAYKILHVGSQSAIAVGSQRAIADVDDYVRWMKHIGNDVKLIGADNNHITTIINKAGFGQNVSTTELNDWHLCIGCAELYCAFTNFALSAMLFDPTKPFQMLDPKSANGLVRIADEHYAGVQQLFDNYFINSGWKV